MKTLLLTILLSLMLGGPSSVKAYSKLENDIIYYIIVDRFVDGDSRNNIPNFAFPLNEQIEEKFPKYANYAKRNRYWLPRMFDETKTKFQHYYLVCLYI